MDLKAGKLFLNALILVYRQEQFVEEIV